MNPRILIADPDPVLRTGLAAALHPLSVEIHVMGKIASVVEAVVELQPDLVIGEVIWGGKPRWDAWSAIRECAEGEQTPLVLLAAGELPDPIGAVRELGWAYFIRRPIDPQLIVELADKLLWMPLRHAAAVPREAAKTPLPPPHAGQTRTRGSAETLGRRPAH